MSAGASADGRGRPCLQATQILAFLHAGAKSKTSEAAQFRQELRRIAVDTRLQGQTRQVQSDGQQHGGMLPVDAFGEGGLSARTIEDEGQRRCPPAPNGPDVASVRASAESRREIALAEVPVDAHCAAHGIECVG